MPVCLGSENLVQNAIAFFLVWQRFQSVKELGKFNTESTVAGIYSGGKVWGVNKRAKEKKHPFCFIKNCRRKV